MTQLKEVVARVDLARPSLGPTTEARFAEAFASGAIITLAEAAQLLGFDEKTLRALTDDLVVRAVRRGRQRGYTEADLRAYLLESTAVPCPSTSPRRAATTTTTSGPKVVAFTARPASKRSAKPRR